MSGRGIGEGNEGAQCLLLSTKGFCHFCLCHMEGKDAACGLQILSSPKDLECQNEGSLVLCQCAWSCTQQSSSTHICQSNIPLSNTKYIMKRFLALHPTETLLSVVVFHHLLNHVHLLHLSSLFMHHPKIHTEL